MDKINIVVDTNVFIDGIFFKDNFCKAIFELKKLNKIAFVMNKDMQDELLRVFAEILIKAYKQNKKPFFNIYPLMALLSTCLWQVNEIDHLIHTDYCKDDHDDDKFIDCCIDGDVKFLITQDAHLNSLSEILEKNHNIQVLSPFQFYTKYKCNQL